MEKKKGLNEEVIQPALALCMSLCIEHLWEHEEGLCKTNYKAVAVL